MIEERDVITILTDAARRGFSTEKLSYLSANLKNGNTDYSPEAAEKIQKIILRERTGSKNRPDSAHTPAGAGASPSAPGNDKNPPIDPVKYLKTGAQLQEMDIRITWLIEDLIPEGSITTVIGPAGYGKSTVCLNLANAVDRGRSWFDRATIQRPVYVLDFENPLAVDVVERARALDLSGVLFWHTAAEVPPPRIDSDEYKAYKLLPPGLLIVDGHRASQRGDENSSKDTGLVMERWKELRDLGFTIILIHHTQKANAEVFRGSQALIDQADHVLYFYPVRQPGSDDPVDVEDPETMTYFLGTKDKTRFKACRLYLKRAGKGHFAVAGNPDDEKIELLKAFLSDRGEVTQKDLLKAAREEMNLGRPVVIRLLKQGETRGIWIMKKGEKNACLYQLVSLYPYIRGVQTDKQDSGSLLVREILEGRKDAKTVDTSEFACLSDAQKQTGKQGSFVDEQTSWEH